MWLPSFLTFPLSLPSLPSVSLPANIQRRFLSYVLKRSLGRFIIGSGFDVERIQAQLSQGWVELERLEVNVEEINAIIPESLPLTVTAGEVAKVSARVPFPNLWSDPLSLTVDSLSLEVSLTQSRRTKSRPYSPEHSHIDLASSVTTAAGDFVHDELDAFEGAQLDRSIRESLVLNTDPFSNDDVPGSFPSYGETGSPTAVETTTVLASLVERILARLQLKVKSIRLRVCYEDEERSGMLELRVGEVRYADETPENLGGPRRTVRSLTLSSVAVYLLPLPKGAPRTPASPRMAFTSRHSSMSSDSSFSSSSSEGNDDFQSMVMSQAVADLRESVMEPPRSMRQGGMSVASGKSLYQSSMSMASGKSVYHSFVDESRAALDEPPNPFEAAGTSEPQTTRPQPAPPPSASQLPPLPSSQRTSRTATPTPAAEEQEVLLLSLGSEDVVLRMITSSHSTPPTREWAKADPDSPASLPHVIGTPPTIPMPTVEVDVTVGTITAALLPSHTALLLAMALSAAKASGASAPQQTQVNTVIDGAQPRFDARLRVRGIYVAMVYDTGKPSPEYEEVKQQFFSRPASVYLPIGHLRLRIDDIAASYAVQEVTRAIQRRAGDRRRKSTSTKAPVADLSIGDVSLFEYIASVETGDDEPPGGAFPVFIFDANLAKQYEIPPGAASSVLSGPARAPTHLPSFPEFDSVDWRNAGMQKKSGEKVWRVKPKGKGILRGRPEATPEPSIPAISIHKEVDETEPASLELLPMHFFLDLSLVERLLPVLRMLAPVVHSGKEHSATPTTAHPGPRQFTTLRDPSGRSKEQPPPRTLLGLRCPMIRLDIRCPAPPNRRGSWGDGAHLRSGIVTLDIHGLGLTMAEDHPRHIPPQRPSHGSYNPAPAGGIHLEWQKMILLFSRVPEKRSAAFLVIGPLAPDPGDEDGVLLPTVRVYSEVVPTSGLHQKSVTCKIPSVQAQVRQPTVEGLQFFADDMTHWLDGAFGDGSAPKPRDDLKMIGSRFFGSKASSSASSSDDYDEEDEAGCTLFRVIISEVELALVVPKAVVKDDESRERILSLRASDVDVKLESNMANKQETSVTLSAMDADLFHHAHRTARPSRLFGRTTPLTLTTHTQPLFKLRFSSLTHADRTKETIIRVEATACLVSVTKELDWIQDLARYAKTPEGVFEDVVPSEVTRISVLLSDSSVHLAAPSMPGALLVVTSVIDLQTVMENYSDESTVDIGIAGLYLLAIDDLRDATTLQMGHKFSLDAWKRAGYAQLLEVETTDLQIIKSSVPASTLLDVLHANVNLTACADSFATLAALAGDMAKLAPEKPASNEPPKRTMQLDHSINVFDSVDMDAFGQAPDIVAGADMIDDDLPTNLDYLDHAAGAKATVDRHTGETLRSWETPDDAAHIQDNSNGTIKILMQEPFVEDPNYWASLPVLKDGVETRMGTTRLRCQNVNVSVFLHDGYDWQRTRKAIEDEIKAMRRRLERIRQLLAEGQKPDASVEQTSAKLFNSIYIGFEPREDMDATQLMAAIDEELHDFSAAETDTQSSWQTLPAAAGMRHNSPAQKKSHIRLAGKRLTRSKRGQIEFALHDVRADVDVYAPDDATAQRVHVTAREFEILDHIKTSTWKKFLTEMKSDSRGNVRETDADMVRVEVTMVRPHLPSTEEEIRLRAKILPLRLHVDQDALDFLKHFFSFTPPSVEKEVEAAPSPEPFFQHVEIFPVELKLDYKPKRVDYSALRQGRTIELMNFFHFEGAEMTLRHVTLSGVTGSTRLSDMLQDIWTPDVKANQLADVISGVSPIRSVVNVGSGVADLILLPIEQYRKDGRVARGVQRGTNSFVRSTALEMMKLGARLATGTQVVLERAEGVLGPKMGDSVVLETVAQGSDDEGEEQLSRYANQPGDVREGVKAAYASLAGNLNSAAQTILAVPMEVYERSGETGPLKAVVRAVPIAVLKPMIGASEAVSKTLWGLRNSLDPEARRDLGDKYKRSGQVD